MILKIKSLLMNILKKYYLTEENEDLEKKYLEIKNIESTGFENAANIYSVSGTSKFGGEIGGLIITTNKKITNQLDKIEIGGLTNYIPAGNSYLIIKLDNKRKIKNEINLDKETGFNSEKQMNN